MDVSESPCSSKLPDPEIGSGGERSRWCQLLGRAEVVQPDLWERAATALPPSAPTHPCSSLFLLCSGPAALGCWEMCLRYLANSYTYLKAHL